MRTPLLSSSLGRILSSILSVVLLSATMTHATQAATKATGSISNTDMGGGVFQYTITLTNVGNTPIETFWYAWVPGEDFMASMPTNIVSPIGWTATITGGGPGNGYAIQWITSSAPLAPGASLLYEFESTDTPAQIAGNSVFFPSTPIGTSFVYEGAPFSGGNSEFIIGVPVGPAAPTLTIKGSKTISTAKSKITIRGTADGLLNLVTYRTSGHKAKSAIGTAKWHFTTALKNGKNVIVINASGPGGTSKSTKMIVTRGS